MTGVQTCALPIYADVATTMIYTHVLRMGGSAVRSPLDSLPEAEEPQSSRW